MCVCVCVYVYTYLPYWATPLTFNNNSNPMGIIVICNSHVELRMSTLFANVKTPEHPGIAELIDLEMNMCHDCHAQT